MPENRSRSDRRAAASPGEGPLLASCRSARASFASCVPQTPDIQGSFTCPFSRLGIVRVSSALHSAYRKGPFFICSSEWNCRGPQPPGSGGPQLASRRSASGVPSAGCIPQTPAIQGPFTRTFFHLHQSAVFHCPVPSFGYIPPFPRSQGSTSRPSAGLKHILSFSGSGQTRAAHPSPPYKKSGLPQGCPHLRSDSEQDQLIFRRSGSWSGEAASISICSFTISMAAAAASSPLLPRRPPARSRAC